MKKLVALILAVLFVIPFAAVTNVSAAEAGGWNTFWLTHYNDIYVEGSGVIVNNTEYNASQAWRYVVSFSPIGGNKYEIVEILDYLNTNQDTYRASIPDGGFLYFLNVGNDYTSTGGENYVSVNCNNAIADAQTWKVGDVFEFVNLNLESGVAPTLTPSLKWHDGSYVCTAKYRVVSDSEELPVESIKIDGDISDNGWKSDKWEIVNGNTGTWQKSFSDTSINAKYQLRTDGEFIYGAFVIYGTPVAGTGNGSATNLRIWFNTTNAAKYTSSFDIYYNGTGAGIKTSLASSSAYATGVASSNAFTAEFAIPFTDIGADTIDQIPYYVSISTNNGSEEPCLYFPKMSSYSSPLSSWLKNCDGDLSKYSARLNNFGYTLSADGTYYILSSLATYGSKNITVPESYNGLPVKEIGDKAFSQTDITSLVLTDNIETIGKAAFAQCDYLTTVDLGGTDYIDFGAFSGCIALTAIDFSDVSEIGNLAFSNCSALETVMIPADVSLVGSNAFAFCENLTDIYCGAESKPANWADTWAANCEATVHWDQTNHTHSYSKNWTTNGTHHWHVCSCGDTSDYAQHTAGDWIEAEDGSKQRFCTVCNELVGVESATVYETGDVNADGKINMLDYMLVKAYYFGKSTPTDAQFKRADINGDGKINMLDYLFVKSYIFNS